VTESLRDRDPHRYNIGGRGELALRNL
jgi:hypothetical protein